MEDYRYLLIPLLTLVLCQVVKFAVESIINKKILWGRLINGSGGMPSSHTSFSTALTMTLGLNLGFYSPLFALSLVFTLIVAYDAMGLRMESGLQAEAINKLFDEIYKDESIKKLKEQLGHKPKEVLAGLILGTLSALFFTYVVFI